MSYGHIQRVIIDDVSMHAASIARYCKIDLAEYEAERQVAITDVVEYREDVSDRAARSRGRRQDEERQFDFVDTSLPQGPYDLHLSLERKSHPIDDHGDRGIIRTKCIVMGFAVAGSPDIFHRHELGLSQMRVARMKYDNLIRDTIHAYEKPDMMDIENMLIMESGREEGHEGVVACLFPAHFNYHWFYNPKRPKAQFKFDFAMGCRMFSLFKAIFPKGPPDDWKLVLNEPRVIKVKAALG